MPNYVRVKDKETGHEYTVPARRFKPDLMTLLKKRAVGSDGRPLPMKPKTTVAKAAAKKSANSAAPSGHEAETERN